MKKVKNCWGKRAVTLRNPKLRHWNDILHFYYSILTTTCWFLGCSQWRWFNSFNENFAGKSCRSSFTAKPYTIYPGGCKSQKRCFKWSWPLQRYKWKFLLWLWEKLVLMPYLHLLLLVALHNIAWMDSALYQCYLLWKRSQGKEVCSVSAVREGPHVVARLMHVCLLLVEAEFADAKRHCGGTLWEKKLTGHAAE